MVIIHIINNKISLTFLTLCSILSPVRNKTKTYKPTVKITVIARTGENQRERSVKAIGTIRAHKVIIIVADVSSLAP